MNLYRVATAALCILISSEVIHGRRIQRLNR